MWYSDSKTVQRHSRETEVGLGLTQCDNSAPSDNHSCSSMRQSTLKCRSLMGTMAAESSWYHHQTWAKASFTGLLTADMQGLILSSFLFSLDFPKQEKLGYWSDWTASRERIESVQRRALNITEPNSTCIWTATCWYWSRDSRMLRVSGRPVQFIRRFRTPGISWQSPGRAHVSSGNFGNIPSHTSKLAEPRTLDPLVNYGMSHW